QYAGDKDGKFPQAPGNGRWGGKGTKLPQELIGAIGESDDTLLEKFFAQGGLSEEEMRAGIHAAIQKQAFIPLFCVSAENNIGVARLMDIIAKYGSSPVDRAKVQAENNARAETELALTDPDAVCYIYNTMPEAA